MLRCVGPNKAMRVLDEIHEGHCGSHSRGNLIAHKACIFGPTPHLSPKKLTLLSSLELFMD